MDNFGLHCAQVFILENLSNCYEFSFSPLLRFPGKNETKFPKSQTKSTYICFKKKKKVDDKTFGMYEAVGF